MLQRVIACSSNSYDRRGAVTFIIRCHQSKGDYQQAIREYQNLIDATSSTDSASEILYLKLGLARLYVLTKDYVRAREELQDIIARSYGDNYVTYQARQMLYCMDLYGM